MTNLIISKLFENKSKPDQKLFKKYENKTAK